MHPGDILADNKNSIDEIDINDSTAIVTTIVFEEDETTTEAFQSSPKLFEWNFMEIVG